MNIPVLIVACVMLLAVVAHILGGTKETASIRPSNENEKLILNWKQAMCAFQMLSIDLLVVMVVLFTIALTDTISFEYELTKIISIIIFLWGVVWLIQLVWLKSVKKTYLFLPQWLIWFICSALLYWGA
jgi:hypothetical protein